MAERAHCSTKSEQPGHTAIFYLHIGKKGSFLASCKDLSISDRKEVMNTSFMQLIRAQQASIRRSAKLAAACPTKIHSNILLDLVYSYFYYYPIIHWSLLQRTITGCRAGGRKFEVVRPCVVGCGLLLCTINNNKLLCPK